MKARFLTLFSGLCALVWLCGCGEGAPKVTSADMKAFEGGAPELKQAWSEAHAAAATNNFEIAIGKLRSLLSQTLTVDQTEAVQNALRAYNTKLLIAADKGDAAAKKVLEELRATGGRPAH